MIKRVFNRTSAQAEACQKEFEKAWADLQANFTDEKEVEAKKLYERCSNYSPQCPICVAGRAEFTNSLNQLRAGNIDEAAKAFKSSFATLTFKMSRIMDAMRGSK